MYNLCFFAGESPFPLRISDLGAGDHRLSILPEGCGNNWRPLTVEFSIEGRDSVDIMCEQFQM